LKAAERINTLEKPQALHKDPLKIKEEVPTTAHDLLEIKTECDKQESANSGSISFDHEIFHMEIKQEPL